MEPRGRRQQSSGTALAGGLALIPSSNASVARLAFEPSPVLRSAHLQSVLGSLPPVRQIVRRRAAALRACAEPLLLDCGQGVRLQGFYSAAARPCGAVAVVLHGWEADAEASCVLSLGAALHARGFDVLRLNLRDHGATHHLNRDIFHSCRLPEVLGAIQAIAARWAPQPLFLAGFSLGGNFLLRVAAEPGSPAAVRAVIAVCPVLDPSSTLQALESGIALYRRHLVGRWSRSLRRKQRVWPQVHDFRRLVRLADLRAMTAALVREHTPFESLQAYLQGYAITGPRLASLRVPAHVLLAEDDPLVPVADADSLAPSGWLQVWRSRYGGHCGFLSHWSQPSAADQFVLDRLEALRAADRTAADGTLKPT